MKARSQKPFEINGVVVQRKFLKMGADRLRHYAGLAWVEGRKHFAMALEYLATKKQRPIREGEKAPWREGDKDNGFCSKPILHRISPMRRVPYGGF